MNNDYHDQKLAEYEAIINEQAVKDEREDLFRTEAMKALREDVEEFDDELLEHIESDPEAYDTFRDLLNDFWVSRAEKSKAEALLQFIDATADIVASKMAADQLAELDDESRNFEDYDY